MLESILDSTDSIVVSFVGTTSITVVCIQGFDPHPPPRYQPAYRREAASFNGPWFQLQGPTGTVQDSAAVALRRPGSLQ
jgi:hypothetical protein